MEYYQIHKAASLVPLPSKEEQQALVDDIRINGQQVPISLYRGKIVDGRSRQNACITLMRPVAAKELPNNMSITEVESFVKSVNTRRNLTRVQKVITAFKSSQKETNPNYAAHARSWGLSKQELYNAKFIAENRPEYIDILFNGGKIEYVDDTGNIKKGTSLFPIRKSIERLVKNTTETQSAVAGSVHIAKAFAQIESAVSFLPSEMSAKEKVFVLTTVAKNIENNQPN